MRTSRIKLALAMTAGMLGLAYASQAAAVCTINSCNAITCSTNGVLASNIDCTNKPTGGITLAGGADLDMHGYSITCTSNCPASAVVMTASSSVVKNTVTTAESEISGAFSTALVDCGSHTGSRVTGIRVARTGAGYGIFDCAQVDKNVVQGPGVGNSFGIYTLGIANSDTITDNYVTDGWAFGIATGGSHNITLDGNVIVVHHLSDQVPIGVNATSSGTTTIKNSTIFGDPSPGDLIDYGGGGVGTFLFGANFCDPSSNACATCISTAACDPGLAPITRP